MVPFVFYCILLFLLLPMSSQSVLRHECSALLQFSKSFQIQNPDDLSPVFCAGISTPKTLHWDKYYIKGIDCCEWDGIMCDSSSTSSNHVVGIDLSCGGLYGNLHSNSSLFHVSHLQTLNLAFNYFNQSQVPSKLGQLSTLTHLNLSYSNLTGLIPSEISLLSKLKSLDLSSNSASGIYSISVEEATWKRIVGNLSDLSELVLHAVNFTTMPLSSVLENLTSSLTTLDLSWSTLRGNFPRISHLSKLRKLDLSSSNFHWKNASLENNMNNLIASSNSLKILDLSECALVGEIPAFLGNLTRLSYLNLNSNHLRGPISSSLGSLAMVSHMDLSENNLIGSIPPWVGNLSQLSFMDFSHNKFNSIIPSSLASLAKLSHIDLSQNNLIGPIPFSLGSLTKLSYLDLSSNNFTSAIPLSVANLTRLSLLGLARNNLNGPIPSFLGSLPQLSSLDLSENNLRGTIPAWLFSDLPNLESLSLNGNNLIGPLPMQVNYQKLVNLDLSNNMLNGSLPAWCFTLPAIEWLKLSSNQFSHINEFSPATPSLLFLYLSSNNLSGSIPTSIFDLVNLAQLDLSSNNFSGFFDLNMFLNLETLNEGNISHNSLLSFSANNSSTEINITKTLFELHIVDFSHCNISDLPMFLKQAPNLIHLDLSNNKIHGEVPKWFHDVGRENLESLILSSNNLEGEIPIPPMTISYFSASHNKFTGGISHSICNLSSLEMLNLSHNNLSGKVPQCLGSLSEYLIVLDLQMNNFHGTVPVTSTKSVCNLETLKLGGNKLEGSIPRSLASCTQLEILDLRHNLINDAFPYWLEGLPNLKVIVLRDNRLHGFIRSPETEHPFPQLIILDLSKNNIMGPLPAGYVRSFHAMMEVTTVNETLYMDTTRDVSYQDSIVVTMKGYDIELQRILTIFTTIDLSINMFEGKIPQVFGQLRSLKGLNLSGNVLNGSIPKSIANLSSLEWLDLSSNKLTGNIPRDLTSLTFLGTLNLSYNQLTGSIPEGNQFGTFSNSSYMGNEGLCGKPLSRECSPGTSSEGQSPSPTLDEEENQELGFGWKPLFLGYASGFVFGGLIAYFVLSTGKPWWLLKLLLKSHKLKRLYLMMQ